MGRYIAHPRALTTGLHEKSHPEYSTYIENAYKNNYAVDDNDLKVYEASTSIVETSMAMRASLVDKDELSRRRAQGFQTWVKGQRK